MDNEELSDLARKVTEALRPHLENEQTQTSKTPAGFDTALKAVGNDPVSRVFLEKGFLTWYAYFLATKGDEGIKKDAEQLSHTELQDIASAISSIEAHGSVKQRVQHILHNSSRHPLRHRKLSLHCLRCPTYLDILSGSLWPIERSRQLYLLPDLSST